MTAVISASTRPNTIVSYPLRSLATTSEFEARRYPHDMITADPLRRLYREWDLRRAGRAMPARGDFDATELKYILGHLSLIDVLRQPLRFRYRVHATQAAERLGFDITGKPLDRLPNAEYHALIQAHHESVVRQRQPVLVLRDRRFSDSRTWKCEALSLPLSASGGEIDMLMSAVVWQKGVASAWPDRRVARKSE